MGSLSSLGRIIIFAAILPGIVGTSYFCSLKKTCPKIPFKLIPCVPMYPAIRTGCIFYVMKVQIMICSPACMPTVQGSR